MMPFVAVACDRSRTPLLLRIVAPLRQTSRTSSNPGVTHEYHQ